MPWFEQSLWPHIIMKKSNPSDMWEDMNDYTDKYIEVLKDNEDEQGEKIHDDHTGPGVPKFVGKYTHGIQEHENELVSDTRNLRDQEKREAKRNEGKDDPDSVLRRVDQYAKKEMAVIDRNEKKEKNRIHADHNSKGTPSSIHDQNHEYDDHTKKMKNEIREVQKEEREDIQRKLGKSRSELTLLDIYDNSELFKSKKKKKKWPSFDVQSHQIAKREGVSEKDADAMLASRGRNHGTRKSLSEMSLAEIYKAADGRRRPEILSKVLDQLIDVMPTSTEDLENIRTAARGAGHVAGQIGATLDRRAKRSGVNLKPRTLNGSRFGADGKRLYGRDETNPAAPLKSPSRAENLVRRGAHGVANVLNRFS